MPTRGRRRRRRASSSASPSRAWNARLWDLWRSLRSASSRLARALRSLLSTWRAATPGSRCPCHWTWRSWKTPRALTWSSSSGTRNVRRALPARTTTRSTPQARRASARAPKILSRALGCASTAAAQGPTSLIRSALRAPRAAPRLPTPSRPTPACVSPASRPPRMVAVRLALPALTLTRQRKLPRAWRALRTRLHPRAQPQSTAASASQTSTKLMRRHMTATFMTLSWTGSAFRAQNTPLPQQAQKTSTRASAKSTTCRCSRRRATPSSCAHATIRATTATRAETSRHASRTSKPGWQCVLATLSRGSAMTSTRASFCCTSLCWTTLSAPSLRTWRSRLPAPRSRACKWTTPTSRNCSITWPATRNPRTAGSTWPRSSRAASTSGRREATPCARRLLTAPSSRSETTTPSSTPTA
mmetsp:Transcript_1204/g.2336  ORF Transcript_1204/g.2336 Transcript_1204/m.2336 type:complete len:416 (-) Transcript_1204:381-1628(-)